MVWVSNGYVKLFHFHDDQEHNVIQDANANEETMFNVIIHDDGDNNGKGSVQDDVNSDPVDDLFEPEQSD